MSTNPNTVSSSRMETFPGACYLAQTNDLIKCVFEKKDCGEGYAYKSTFEKQNINDVEWCDVNHRQYTGMCVDELMCTMNSINCLNPTKFEDNNPFCTMEYNRLHESATSGLGKEFSLFGSCSTTLGGKTCVYSKSDCDLIDGATFTKPGEYGYYNSDERCTCDKTKVGACVRGGEYHCAVSANACDASSEYKTWNEVDLMPNVECYLCDDFAKEWRTRSVDEAYMRTPSVRGPGKRDAIEIGVSAGVGLLIGMGLMAIVMKCCCRTGGTPLQKDVSGAGAEPVV